MMDEYQEYLNKIKLECLQWAGGDKDWAIAMFDKKATPYYYYENDKFNTLIHQASPHLLN